MDHPHSAEEACCPHHHHHHHHAHQSADDEHVQEPTLLTIEPSRLTAEGFDPESQDLFQHLASYLPFRLRSQPREAQVEAILKMMKEFKKHQREQEQAREMYNAYLEVVRTRYKPLHPQLYDIKNWGFVDTLRDALRLSDKFSDSTSTTSTNHNQVSNEEEEEEIRIRSILEEVHEGIYAFDCFTPEFTKLLLEEVKNFEDWCAANGLRVHRPNSMNNYGAILDDFGFESVLDQLMQLVVAPMSRYLYPYIGDTLDSHHGFVVEYAMGKDVKLDFHVDMSDVTLNVCLGKQFTGGNLYFGGVRCELHQQTQTAGDEDFEFEHQPGKGILHVGKHRHLARKITSGERHNLILWCRSSRFEETDSMEGSRAHKCPEWCGVAKAMNKAKRTATVT
jgi:hypothetical protein